MTADFYPRLTAAAHDNEVCQRLVNEQAEVGLLIAVPGVLVTMGFAPLVIHLFYSGRFEGAVPLLEWQSLGMLLQLLAWPVAFVLLAKGDGRMFFWMELVANLVNLLLIWLGISLFGLVGAGMAYFLFYGIYWWGTYFVVRLQARFLLVSSEPKTVAHATACHRAGICRVAVRSAAREACYLPAQRPSC